MTLARLKTHYRDITIHDVVFIDINQDLRPARVLAVVGDTSLIEYLLPHNWTALAFCKTMAWRNPETQADVVERLFLRPCTYRSLLNKWLRAVITQAGAWQGNSFRGKMPTPQEVLDERDHQNKGTHVAKGWRSVRGDPVDYQWKQINKHRCVIAHAPTPLYPGNPRPEAKWRMWLFIDGRVMRYRGNVEHFQEWMNFANEAHKLASLSMPKLDAAIKDVASFSPRANDPCPVPSARTDRI